MENENLVKYASSNDRGGLFLPSFILSSAELSIEEKFIASTILSYLIFENKGQESSALFSELESELGIAEDDIVKGVQTLQRMELLTCFRDGFNIGGDMTLYVGFWTREAYMKEFKSLH